MVDIYPIMYGSSSVCCYGRSLPDACRSHTSAKADGCLKQGIGIAPELRELHCELRRPIGLDALVRASHWGGWRSVDKIT